MLGAGLALAALAHRGPTPIVEAREGIAAAIVTPPREPEAPKPEITPPPEPAPRADANLDRRGYSWVAGGVFILPPSFESADGSYDLVIHFHGNTKLVAESFAYAKVDAAVLIINLGVSSGPYEQRFASPGALDEILTRTREALEKRGLQNARPRRVALTGWSAGYGAALRLLEQPGVMDRVDAVALLDGIHCGFVNGRQLRVESIAPFVRFARLATEGKKLFTITHSEITPPPTAYAGTHATTDALLRQLGVERKPSADAPPLPALASMAGAIPKRYQRPLEPLTEAQQGWLHVRGFAGDQAKDHALHLLGMATTALPELVRWWSAGQI